MGVHLRWQLELEDKPIELVEAQHHRQPLVDYMTDEAHGRGKDALHDIDDQQDAVRQSQ